MIEVISIIIVAFILVSSAIIVPLIVISKALSKVEDWMIKFSDKGKPGGM